MLLIYRIMSNNIRHQMDEKLTADPFPLPFLFHRAFSFLSLAASGVSVLIRDICFCPVSSDWLWFPVNSVSFLFFYYFSFFFPLQAQFVNLLSRSTLIRDMGQKTCSISVSATFSVCVSRLEEFPEIVRVSGPGKIK
ncbi:hypothetical protein AMECASPLE_015273 [Ameca splendens]|uniref:Uncharacterized protein n=1 Tax=Ameca splendens TaxID=208324 RepID=A0ABV0ZAN2_9TELE